MARATKSDSKGAGPAPQKRRKRARIGAPEMTLVETSASEATELQVYKAIRRALMSGALEPGARISSRSIAESLGVSAMPVREALKRLEADGGENGAKAAAILRGMNAVAQPVFFTGGYASKPDDMFVGAQALGGITALPGGARIGAPHLTAEDQAKRIEQAELRGFYLGRNKALGILFAERRKWEMGEEGDVRAVIARVSEAICYMQKEG